MNGSLIEIPPNDWPALADLYSNHKQYASSYNTIQNFIKWLQKCPALDVKMFALHGDWRSDGTFVCIYRNEHLIKVFSNTRGATNERLLSALNSLRIDDTHLYFGFPEKNLKTIEQHFIDCGVGREAFQADQTFWYHISREKAEQFVIESPPGVHLKSLQQIHAEQVNSVWPFRDDKSVIFVRHLIRFNTSVGAFDDNDNLLAWCIMLPLGSLGLLQVEEAHKRKGLGSLVVRQISKCIAASGEEVCAPVVVNNVASRSMFEKLGFEIVDSVYWAKMVAKTLPNK